MDKNIDFIALTDNNKNSGCVAAVGSFDGVHLGHRAMLRAVREEAEKIGASSAVFTFNSDDNPKGAKLLADSKKKLQLLKEEGVDVAVSAPFSALRETEAEDFAEFLFESMGVKAIVCGYDFRFGKGRRGDADLIRNLLSPKGVKVITPPALFCGNDAVSSTAIRKLVASGEIAKANRLLGREFSFESTVSHGAKLGRTLGFPTINQTFPPELVLPKFGVYAVEAVADGRAYNGIANLGVKPTVSEDSVPICETHLFDFSGDCYGKNAEIKFLEFIREEKRFPSLEELKAQISRDKTVVLEYFEKRGV